MGNKLSRKQQYENEPLLGSLEQFSEQEEFTWKDDDLKKIFKSWVCEGVRGEMRDVGFQVVLQNAVYSI